MEKLLNLLNEYDKSENVNAYRWEIEGGDIIGYNKFRGGYETINVSESVIISKWYEFIKRLVDNNKIDKSKIDTRLVRNVENHYDEDGYWVENSYEDYSDIDTLLMLLSISDTPIEDLILYLK